MASFPRIVWLGFICGGKEVKEIVFFVVNLCFDVGIRRGGGVFLAWF